MYFRVISVLFKAFVVLLFILYFYFLTVMMLFNVTRGHILKDPVSSY